MAANRVMTVCPIQFLFDGPTASPSGELSDTDSYEMQQSHDDAPPARRRNERKPEEQIIKRSERGNGV